MKTFRLCCLFWLLLLLSCSTEDYTPKPRGFFRITLPQKVYKKDSTGCPFEFERPAYTVLSADMTAGAAPCWKNLDFPQFNARLHISYFDIGPGSSFGQLTEDARTFAFKHTAKATAIDQSKIERPEAQAFGLIYHIRGNTASNVQFYVSDSTHRYLRAALYFNEKPHVDSIKPVLDFIEADIMHMVNTFTWK